MLLLSGRDWKDFEYLNIMNDDKKSIMKHNL